LRLPDAIVVAFAREIGGELLTYDLRVASVAERVDDELGAGR
jgi:predicted nucleic acid-binding protein